MRHLGCRLDPRCDIWVRTASMVGGSGCRLTPCWFQAHVHTCLKSKALSKLVRTLTAAADWAAAATPTAIARAISLGSGRLATRSCGARAWSLTSRFSHRSTERVRSASGDGGRPYGPPCASACDRQPPSSQSCELQPSSSQSCELQPSSSQSCELQPSSSQSCEIQPSSSQSCELQPSSSQSCELRGVSPPASARRPPYVAATMPWRARLRPDRETGRLQDRAPHRFRGSYRYPTDLRCRSPRRLAIPSRRHRNHLS